MSTYILQKDTIATMAGTTFILKSGLEFTFKQPYYLNYPSGWYYSKEFVENNPEWFKEYKPFDEYMEFINSLSEVQKGLYNKVIAPYLSEKNYTEEDMRKCFYAPIHNIHKGDRVDTFEDYLKTLKQK